MKIFENLFKKDSAQPSAEAPPAKPSRREIVKGLDTFSHTPYGLGAYCKTHDLAVQITNHTRLPQDDIPAEYYLYDFLKYYHPPAFGLCPHVSVIITARDKPTDVFRRFEFSEDSLRPKISNLPTLSPPRFQPDPLFLAFLKKHELLFTLRPEDHSAFPCSPLMKQLLDPVIKEHAHAAADRERWIRSIEDINAHRTAHMPPIDGLVAQNASAYKADVLWLREVGNDPSKLLEKYSHLGDIDASKPPYSSPNAHPVFKLMRAFKLILERPFFLPDDTDDPDYKTDGSETIIGPLSAQWIGDVAYRALIEETLFTSAERVQALDDFVADRAYTGPDSSSCLPDICNAVSRKISDALTEQSREIEAALKAAAEAVGYEKITPRSGGSPYR